MVVPTPASTPFTLTTRTSGPMCYTLQVISDSNGHAVRTIKGTAAAAQSLSIPWDLNDDSGHSAPDGFYTLALSGGSSAGPRSVTRCGCSSAARTCRGTPIDPLYWTPGHTRVGRRRVVHQVPVPEPADPALQRADVRAVLGAQGRLVRVGRWAGRRTRRRTCPDEAPTWDDQIMSVPGTYSSGGTPG